MSGDDEQMRNAGVVQFVKRIQGGKMGAQRQLQLAERLANLGTETAFAVSKAAADWASAGNDVFSFHLGDIDLATPRNIVDAMQTAIDAGYTGYCAGAGIEPLRHALANDIGRARGLDLGPEHIAVQPGGKPVITKFIQTLMNPGDGVLFPSPGYPIYESQVEYFGGTPMPYGYSMTPTGFEIDMARIEELAPHARLLIYNNLQNPLGCESSREEMERIAELAVEHNLWVLSDEAYFEMRYSGTSTSIASLPGMSERTIILYTFSKRFAMTGWRLGCAAGPSRVIEAIAKLNTNDESCTTHFVQHAGVAALSDPSGAAPLLDELRRRRDATAAGLAEVPGVEFAIPEATFYLFPRVAEAMDRVGHSEVGEFARAALHATGMSFCTRHHFGRPLAGEDDRFIRLAYSGIGTERIGIGLERFAEWIDKGAK